MKSLCLKKYLKDSSIIEHFNVMCMILKTYPNGLILIPYHPDLNELHLFFRKKVFMLFNDEINSFNSFVFLSRFSCLPSSLDFFHCSLFPLYFLIMKKECDKSWNWFNHYNQLLETRIFQQRNHLDFGKCSFMLYLRNFNRK